MFFYLIPQVKRETCFELFNVILFLNDELLVKKALKKPRETFYNSAVIMVKKKKNIVIMIDVIFFLKIGPKFIPYFIKKRTMSINTIRLCMFVNLLVYASLITLITNFEIQFSVKFNNYTILINNGLQKVCINFQFDW